jgi:hypothetical protein
MSDAWERPHWTAGGGDAFLFYVIYGVVDAPEPVTLPAEVDGRAFTRSEHASYLQGFEEGPMWEQFAQSDPATAARVRASDGCIAFAGPVADPSSLAYLRITLEAVELLLDRGGIAVYDAFIFQWFDPAQWRAAFRADDEPHPRRHVVTFHSPQENGLTWVHTRGLRKFGRPELSVHDVQAEQLDAVFDLCARLIELQAFGRVIAEQQTFAYPELGRFIAEHGGDLEDPDFNNVHIELRPLS